MFKGKDFFLNAFKDGVPEEVEQVDVIDVDIPVEEVAEEKVETVEVPKDEVATKYNIDGEEFTIDQIKEWKQNGLRQSDYTRKTQELANQRKELEALKVEIPTEDAIPTDLKRLEKLERELEINKLDLEITEFKTKYPDFDEVKILNEAEKRGIFDLEFVYKALRNDNSSSQVNIEELKAQAIEEYKVKITAEKQKNKEATSGSIISSVPGQAIVDYGDELSQSEKDYCNKRGWTFKDYVEMKSNKY